MKAKLPPTVSFVYDEANGKWNAIAINVASPVEAAQALNSVILTCKTIQTRALPFTQVAETSKGVYHVMPAVIVIDPEMN